MKLKKSAYALNMVGLLTLTNLVYAAPAPSDIIVVGDTKHDISIPIRDVPKFSSHAKKGNSGFSLEKILQKNLAFLQISNFQGIGVGLGSYAVTTPAPDLSFSVGMTQALEWVDPDIAIFDKATGTVAAGFPKPGSAVWYGFGGPCETEDSGKPIVKYDQLANRWVISRQANADPNTGPFYQCVAISTSEDATDSYYRYAFPTDSLNNYAKMGLWSDAYYLATFLTGPVSHGARACALDRDKMLLGLAATAQCKQMTTDESGPLTPADLEGSTQTPGLPGYFFSIEAPHDLLLFKFHVDFANPANTTFTSAISLPVQPFISPCSSLNGTACVVQPNTTNKLDILVDRFSSRIKYHQFENYGSILLAHNIEGPPPKLAPAIRWYELRVANNPQANPTIYQQATYAPDSKARFTGSLAMDKVQNLALGYTVSSSTVHPSPELGYHLSEDPLNTLTTQALVTGRGSQTEGSAWSISSSMAIDPVDYCTFWYNNEYLKTDGSFNWSTAITYFKMASCS